MLVRGNETGALYFQGRGAGARPTASAIVSDLAGLASGTLPTTQRDYLCWPDRAIPTVPLADETNQGPWFVYKDGRPGEVVASAASQRPRSQGIAGVPLVPTRRLITRPSAVRAMDRSGQIRR